MTLTSYFLLYCLAPWSHCVQIHAVFMVFYTLNLTFALEGQGKMSTSSLSCDNLKANFNPFDVILPICASWSLI